MTADNFSNLKQAVINRLRDKLPEHIYYHTPEHTLYVLDAVEKIGAYEKTPANELMLIKIAALYHDIGFINTSENHEDESCSIAKEELPHYGLKDDEIEQICGMIAATEIPQKPNTKLEEILADADLEYLGTPDFGKTAHLLFLEWKHWRPNFTLEEWNKIQINFLENHHYFTDYCKRFRDAAKLEHLTALRKKVPQ